MEENGNERPLSEEEQKRRALEEEHQQIIAKLTKGLRPGEHPYSLRRALESFEAKHLKKVLEVADNNVPKAAYLLGISTKSLRAKMKKHGLK